MHLDQVLPHPVIPTYVSTVSVKYNNHFGGRHGKQTSDSTLSTSNIGRLDEHLKEVKLSDEDEANRDTMRSFHGSVDSPYNEDNGYRSPGIPPKDSTGSNRPSDPYAQYGAPPTPHQTSFSHKSLSRANSHHLQNSPDEPASSQSSSSASFSSFFGGKRKKPKNNIAKTNSTFVAKITTHENLSKIIANRVNEDMYLFWNMGRTFTWSDVNQKSNVSKPSSCLIFFFFLWFLTYRLLKSILGTVITYHIQQSVSNLTRCQCVDAQLRPPGCHHWIQHGRYYLVRSTLQQILSTQQAGKKVHAAKKIYFGDRSYKKTGQRH